MPQNRDELKEAKAISARHKTFDEMAELKAQLAARDEEIGRLADSNETLSAAVTKLRVDGVVKDEKFANPEGEVVRLEGWLRVGSKAQGERHTIPFAKASSQRC